MTGILGLKELIYFPKCKATALEKDNEMWKMKPKIVIMINCDHILVPPGGRCLDYDLGEALIVFEFYPLH